MSAPSRAAEPVPPPAPFIDLAGPAASAPSSVAPAPPVASAPPGPALDAIPHRFVESFRFSGQFRVNAYDTWKTRRALFNDDDAQGIRLRLRPTFDAEVTERVGLHLQLNIGHIRANQSNARFAPDGSEPLPDDVPAFGVRQVAIRTAPARVVTG